MCVAAGRWGVDNVKTSSFHAAQERTREPVLAAAAADLTLGALGLLWSPEQAGSSRLGTRGENEVQGASQGHMVRQRGHQDLSQGLLTPVFTSVAGFSSKQDIPSQTWDSLAASLSAPWSFSHCQLFQAKDSV